MGLAIGVVGNAPGVSGVPVLVCDVNKRLRENLLKKLLRGDAFGWGANGGAMAVLRSMGLKTISPGLGAPKPDNDFCAQAGAVTPRAISKPAVQIRSRTIRLPLSR